MSGALAPTAGSASAPRIRSFCSAERQYRYFNYFAAGSKTVGAYLLSATNPEKGTVSFPEDVKRRLSPKNVRYPWQSGWQAVQAAHQL